MWDFDTCTLCKGTGKIEAGTCPVCKGMGLWEYMVNDNQKAVTALLNGEPPETETVKALCDRRLAQVTPDNIEDVIKLLEAVLKNEDFDALHASGAKRWGWAWVHANRFAIGLVNLCGVDSAKHPLAVSRLAWKWLTEENPKKD
jgi:hypothetical protein